MGGSYYRFEGQDAPPCAVQGCALARSWWFLCPRHRAMVPDEAAERFNRTMQAALLGGGGGRVESVEEWDRMLEGAARMKDAILEALS